MLAETSFIEEMAFTLIELVEDPTPVVIEKGIGLYKEAAQAVKTCEVYQGELKAAIDTALSDLNLEFVEGQAGKVQRTPASTRESWDGKVLTRLCMDNPAILQLIGHARKVTPVAPGLRIT